MVGKSCLDKWGQFKALTKSMMYETRISGHARSGFYAFQRKIYFQNALTVDEFELYYMQNILDKKRI